MNGASSPPGEPEAPAAQRTERRGTQTERDTTARAPQPRRPRGLFDFVLACLLIYGVYANTPIGALGEWAFRAWVLEQEHSPSVFSTFRGRDAHVDITVEHLEHGVLASKSFPAAIQKAAAETQVDPELLAVVAASNGRCDAQGCFVRTPAYLTDLLQRPVDEQEVPVLWFALGLAQGARRLAANHEVALEAMYVPPHAVKRAIRQATASGSSTPLEVESHAPFFAPSLRRGPLQEAVNLLALHRLRTLMWPTPAGAQTTSPYGYRIHPVTGTRKFHNGTDIGVGTGTPLRSAHRGRVGRTGKDSISGNYVHLRHGFGIVSTHCHMSEVSIHKDDPLQRGQTIGLSGATGRVTGPHLHYILRIDGKTVDPEAYGEAPARRIAANPLTLPKTSPKPVPITRPPSPTSKKPPHDIAPTQGKTTASPGVHKTHPDISSPPPVGLPTPPRMQKQGKAPRDESSSASDSSATAAITFDKTPPFTEQRRSMPPSAAPDMATRPVPLAEKNRPPQPSSADPQTPRPPAKAAEGKQSIPAQKLDTRKNMAGPEQQP